jgi:hypothetical protein
MRHGVIIFEEREDGASELASDDRKGDLPESCGVGRHKRLAVAKRPKNGPELTEHPEEQPEEDDEDRRVGGEERALLRREPQRTVDAKVAGAGERPSSLGSY